MTHIPTDRDSQRESASISDLTSDRISDRNSDRDADTDAPEDASAATGRDHWLQIMGEIGDEAGHFTALGARHWAMFSQEGGQLLVTFDTLAAARARKGQMPHLYDFASNMGWSYLCVIADGETWFRDPAITAFFDKMVYSSFFDGFDRVQFYGAGMAGYAACAYSVTAPGATVVAVAPRATMAPARVPFETRDRAARRLDFTTRYGFAPDMLRAAREAWILRDPLHSADAAQSALFQGNHVTHLNLRLMGDRAEHALQELDILPKLLSAAMKGEMSAVLFANLWRARRKFGGYLKQLLLRTDTAGRETLSYAICANVARRTRAPKFRRRLEEMDAARAAKTAEPV